MQPRKEGRQQIMFLSKPNKNYHAEDEPRCITTSEKPIQHGGLLIRTD